MADGEQDRSEVGRYRIGSVADLTGIPPHTLRAWERRYDAAVPVRTDAGFRLYSEEDVGRLSLIKRLSDLGHAIGSIANLGLRDLQERLARVEERAWRSGGAARPPSPSPRGDHGPSALFVMEPSVSAQIEQGGGDASGLKVCRATTTLEDLVAALDDHAGAEPVVVLVGLPRLGPTPAVAARRLVDHPAAAAVLVLYDFAPRKTIRQMTLTGVRLVHGWPGIGVLRAIVREALEVAPGPGILRLEPAPNGSHAAATAANPPRVFSDVDLGRLRELETAVDCECPNHLAQILSGLVAFEEYSRDCESRDARDVELHAHLFRETGRARVIMERALIHLCQEEGIDL